MGRRCSDITVTIYIYIYIYIVFNVHMVVVIISLKLHAALFVVIFVSSFLNLLLGNTTNIFMMHSACI